MADTDPPLHLDALGPGGRYRTRNRTVVTDVTGAPLAELSLVPGLYVSRTTDALRRAGTFDVAARASALTDAGEAFARGTVGGVPLERHEELVSRVSGLPLSVVRAATGVLAEAARQAVGSAHRARPQGSADDWRAASTTSGSGVWVRRGEVFAVNAAGNHPGVHGLWLEALALGYRILVRPSRREPFTPYRLVTALREAGFGNDRVALLPTDHTVADQVLRGADLAMVYGGADIVDKYARDATVLPQGPGRSKILVTADGDWKRHLDIIVSSVAHEAGTACVNTTTVLVEGDPTPLARALAERLAALPPLPPCDPGAVLPVSPLDEARRLADHVRRLAEGTRAWLGADSIVHDLGDGSAALRPAVHQLDRPDAPQTAAELPFPCVWVAPWRRADGVAPLRHSLVLTALTRDERLVDTLLAEPTIGNVYVGGHPTHWMAPGVPHDGYLADFLMRSKAVIRD